MMTAGVAFRTVFVGFTTDNLAMLVNQLPSFLDVYALGMLGAILYIRLRHWVQTPKVKTAVSILSVATACPGDFALTGILRFQSEYSLNGMDALRQAQWIVRLPLALTILTCILVRGVPAPEILQKLLDNRLMRFLAAISLNLYIWHQVFMRTTWCKPFFPDTLHSEPTICKLRRIRIALLFAVHPHGHGVYLRPGASGGEGWIQKLRDKKGANANMKDPRLQKLCNLLVNYSCELKPE